MTMEAVNRDKLIQELTASLQLMIDDASLSIQALPHCPQLSLYLINPEKMRRPFSPDEVARIENYPCYWGFCWASGQVLAQYILTNPNLVKDKHMIDFGAGSGVVAIAAIKAGARSAVVCDLDRDALAACRLNAELNGVTLKYSQDIAHITSRADLLIAADVLYDRSNLIFLDQFLDIAKASIIGDSRIRNFYHSKFHKIDEYHSMTIPDLDEADEFRSVSLYHSI